jgi:hypothetical protein
MTSRIRDVFHASRAGCPFFARDMDVLLVSSTVYRDIILTTHNVTQQARTHSRGMLTVRLNVIYV